MEMEIKLQWKAHFVERVIEMYEYNEFEKCRFCTHYDNFEGCGHSCDHHYNGFKPDNDKIIAKAKERGLSVIDVVALITLNNQ